MLCASILCTCVADNQRIYQTCCWNSLSRFLPAVAAVAAVALWIVGVGARVGVVLCACMHARECLCACADNALALTPDLEPEPPTK